MRNTVNLLLSVVFLGAVAAVSAADLKLEAKLVWGTNDEKGGPDCKPVDAELAAGLHGIYKWKNYFEITNKTACIPLKQTRDLKMSDLCTLQVRNLGASRVEVKCIGRGKEVVQGAHTLHWPAWWVLGGNADNNTAWFIGLRSSDGKAGEAGKVISKN
jgi:hypothetical protein